MPPGTDCTRVNSVLPVEVNDENAYQFSEHNDGSTKLYTFGRFYNKVEEIFGENDEWWNPIIKQWFEERTGLKVTWIE